MTLESDTKHAENVRRMFTRIANRYDLLNRLMTLGQDRRWRRETIRSLQLLPNDWLLDVGTGTGDLAFEALTQEEHLHIVACDFTSAMIRLGQVRPEGQDILWIIADAQALPFRHNAFNAVVSGFLLRNVEDVNYSLAEQTRILKRGGRIASLDTTPPAPGPFQALVHLYLRWIIPALGRWIAGDERAYRYLPDTTQAFIPAPELAQIFQTSGFSDVGFIQRMLGTIAIHWGVKKTDKTHAGRSIETS